MIIFLYGEDSYRSRGKLQEIVEGYKKIHKSGLNLIYVDVNEKEFAGFLNELKTVSMFAEKKLLVLKNMFLNKDFLEKFLDNLKDFKDSKDIIVVFEDGNPDQRTKIFKQLLKEAKSQEFKFLQGIKLRNFAEKELKEHGAKIAPDALALFLNYVGSDTWRLGNEINKLVNFKQGKIIGKKDVEALVKPRLEVDIFKTIDALAKRDKRQAMLLVKEHLENGDEPLYLLSMYAYQFKNLLVLKQMIDKGMPYPAILKGSLLHPFVVQKTYSQCGRFSFLELKKICQKIFQVDLDIKLGKVEPEAALELLVSEI